MKLETSYWRIYIYLLRLDHSSRDMWDSDWIKLVDRVALQNVFYNSRTFLNDGVVKVSSGSESL